MNKKEFLEYEELQIRMRKDIKKLKEYKLGKEIEEEEENEKAIKLISSISTEESKFTTNSKKIIGQLKKGVLLKGKISIREGEIYYYGRSYAPQLDTILRLIKDAAEDPEHEQEFLKLGKEKLLVLKLIMDKNKEIEELRKKMILDKIIYFDEKTELLSLDNWNINTDKLYIEEVVGIKIFADDFWPLDSQGDKVSLKDNYGYFREKHKKVIEKEKGILVNNIKNYIEKMKKINQELLDKGGKYLIASTF